MDTSSLLNKDNVFISALPLDEDDHDKNSCCVSGRRIKIIDQMKKIFNEFVSPKDPRSIFALYIASNGSDLEILRKLKALTDEFRNLIDSSILENRQSAANILVRTLQRISSARLNNALATFTAETKKVQPNMKPAPPPSLPGPSVSLEKMKAAAPPIPTPPILNKMKAAAPPIPTPPFLNKMKAAAPPVPTPQFLNKMKAPPLPGLTQMKAGGSKSTPPLPPLVNRIVSFPSGSAQPVVDEKPIFPAPLLLGEVDTRRIHWQSIPVSRFKGSVFEVEMFRNSDDYTDTLIDFDRAKSHFVKSSALNSPTASVVVSAASSPLQSAIFIPASILPVKRSQQIEIFLTGRKNILSKAGGIHSIITSDYFDDSSPNSIKTLEILEFASAQLYPSQEEEELIRSSTSTLAKAESFLAELIAVPQFKLAVHYIATLVTVPTSLEQTENYFEQLSRAITTITQSKPFVKFLKLVGTMVVYLGNGKKTNFNGFALESVSQLKKIASFTEKEYSVLNLVVECMNPEDVNVLISSHLSLVESLLELDFAEQVEKSLEIEKDINSIDCSKLDQEFHAKLVAKLNEFRSRMNPKLTVSKKLREKALKESQTFLRYVAENEKRDFNDILSRLNDLRNDLVVAQQQNDARQRKVSKKFSTNSI